MAWYASVPRQLCAITIISHTSCVVLSPLLSLLTRVPLSHPLRTVCAFFPRLALVCHAFFGVLLFYSLLLSPLLSPCIHPVSSYDSLPPIICNTVRDALPMFFSLESFAFFSSLSHAYALVCFNNVSLVMSSFCVAVSVQCYAMRCFGFSWFVLLIWVFLSLQFLFCFIFICGCKTVMH